MRVDGALEKAGLEVLDNTGEGAATMFKGKVWFNSDDGVFKYYDGSAIEIIRDYDQILGVTSGEVDMGDFTGSTITSDQSVKECLQDLETQLDTNTTSISNTSSQVGNLVGSGTYSGSPTGYLEYTTSVYTPNGKITLDLHWNNPSTNISVLNNYDVFIDTSTSPTYGINTSYANPASTPTYINSRAYWSTTAGTHTVKVRFRINGNNIQIVAVGQAIGS